MLYYNKLSCNVCVCGACNLSHCMNKCYTQEVKKKNKQTNKWQESTDICTSTIVFKSVMFFSVRPRGHWETNESKVSSSPLPFMKQQLFND